MLKTVYLMVLLGTMSASSIRGQTTIGTNNFMPAPGTVLQYRSDAGINADFYDSLTSGSGGPMQWNFTDRNFGQGYSLNVVSSSTTPAIDSFPEANLVFLMVVGSDSNWIVQQSLSNAFWTLGTVAHNSGAEIITVYKDNIADWVFPIAYGNNWTSHHTSSQEFSTFRIDIIDTTHYTTDAWGTAIYGSVSIPVLRVISDEQIITKTFNGTTLLDSLMTHIITANFVAAGFNSIMSAAKSVSSSTIYTAYALEDFLNGHTGVVELASQDVPNDFILSQNYPNPFNPQTDIQFTVPTRADVKLAVYDILGREIKVLVDKSMGAGSYIVDWDGTNKAGEPVASGIYFYRMMTAGLNESRKMVLMK